MSTVQTYAQPFAYNRNIMNVVGTTVSLQPAVLAEVQNAHSILKNKKATTTDVNQANAFMTQMRLMDTNAYFLQQLGVMGTKQVTNPAYVSAVMCKTGDILHLPTLMQYYKALPDYIRALYNAKARVRINAIDGYDFDNETLVKLESTGALFAYEYLCTGVAYCVTSKIGKDGTPQTTRCLLTRNLNIVSQLFKYGCVMTDKPIEQATWIETMEKNLYNTASVKNLRDSKCSVLCLRPDHTNGNRPVYTITKRQSPLSLTDAEEVTLYPLECCSVLGMYLNSVDTVGTDVYTLRHKLDDGTIHKMNVTADRNTVGKCYPDAEDNTDCMCTAINAAGLRGYNAGNMRIGMYRVDKDEVTLGGFYPETIVSASVAVESTIHTNENKRDTVAARMIFNTRVSGLKKDQYSVFESYIPDLTNISLKKDKRALVLAWGARQSDEDLYSIMDKAPLTGTLYDDLGKACQSRRKVMPVYFKHFTPLQIPIQATMEAQLDIYKRAMQTGVLRVTYMSKTGVIKRILLTNNMRVLLNTYGKHYIAEWETTSVRLNTAMTTLKAHTEANNPAISVDVRAMLDYYNLTNVLFPEGIPDDVLAKDGKSLRTSAVVKLLQDALTERAKHPSSNTPNGCIRGRVADASALEATYDGKDVSVYRTLKTHAIIRAEYAPINTKQ